jgi:hypothetical protein
MIFFPSPGLNKLHSTGPQAQVRSINPHRITFLLLLVLFKVRFSISSVSFGQSRKPRDFELRSILDQFFDTPRGSEVLAQRRAERGAPSGRV